MASFSPIALFVYNRLEHTLKTIDALSKNKEALNSELVIFSDGPRGPADVDSVMALRNELKKVSGFKSVRLIEREKNLGLAESIITGVTRMLEEQETVIVLEDDLVSSPFFLQFMNEALVKYRQDERVASVLGYCFPIGDDLPETYFMRGADCWGWATWRRAWKHFERDGKKLLASIEAQNLEKLFDLNNSIKYTQMLRDQIDGKNNSWAIRWRASTFLRGMLSLYPGRSLIQNIGFDGTGTHCSETNIYYTLLAESPIQICDIEVVVNRNALNGMMRFYRGNRYNLFKRGKNYLQRKWNKLFA